MINDPIGFFFPLGNTMRINNAFVEEASCTDNSNGSILISYPETVSNNMTTVQNLRLNINRNTTVLNAFGQNMCICCLQRGMRVNVVAESRTTRSIPPQSNALFIMVQNIFPARPPIQPLPPRPPFPSQPPRPPFPPQPPRPPQQSATTTGRIIQIDFNENYLITANPNNMSDQTRFNISNSTTFTNRFGAPIRFSSLQPGQMVRVTHGNFSTFSIPPQTTAFNVQQL